MTAPPVLDVLEEIIEDVLMAPTTDTLQDFIGRAVCDLPLFG